MEIYIYIYICIYIYYGYTCICTYVYMSYTYIRSWNCSAVKVSGGGPFETPLVLRPEGYILYIRVCVCACIYGMYVCNYIHIRVIMYV